MKQLSKSLGLYATLAAAVLLLAACQTEEQAAKPAPEPVQAAPVTPVVPPPPPAETPEQLAEKAARAAAQAEFDSVVALYNSGDYHGAIKRAATVVEDVKVYKDLELDTLKFSAFSYCLINRTLLCRQQFEKALKLDPTFTLKEGEIGHPLWWPVFLQAKKREGIK